MTLCNPFRFLCRGPGCPSWHGLSVSPSEGVCEHPEYPDPDGPAVRARLDVCRVWAVRVWERRNRRHAKRKQVL
jgi:hypothetical protein